MQSPHVLVGKPTYNRLKGKLEKRQATKSDKPFERLKAELDKSQTTTAAKPLQDGESPFFSKYTDYPPVVVLQDSKNPGNGQITLFNASDTEVECYDWPLYADGLDHIVKQFEAGACGFTASSPGNITRTGYDAFSGNIPLVSIKNGMKPGTVSVKVAGQTHSGYQAVLATAAGAAFTAAQLECASDVLRNGTQPFIESTDDYEPCPGKPLDVGALLISMGIAAGFVLACCCLVGFKQETEESQQGLSTSAAATSEIAQPRSSWCCFMRKPRTTEDAVDIMDYRVLEQSTTEQTAPAEKVTPLEVEAPSL